MTAAPELAARLASAFPAAEAALVELVAIPSVSVGEQADPVALRTCAHAVARLLTEAGADEARLVERPGAHPAVVGVRRGRPDLPVALLYAHYDVVPADPAAWATPPFEAVRRGDRLHGRGTADDKAAIAVHLATLAATSAQETGTVIVFVEGEEEIGSPNAAALLAGALAGLPSPQLVLVPDADAWTVEDPYLTTALRGCADLHVRVEALAGPVHSGLFGGVVPDALSAAARLLASLLDDAGRPAVEGLAAMEADPAWTAPSEQACLADVGALPSVRAIGDGSVAARLFAQPAIAVTGLTAVPVEQATNQLVHAVEARVSVRTAPTQHPAEAAAAVAAHLRAQAPWGVAVTTTTLRVMRGWAAPPGAAGREALSACLSQAWGAPTRLIGSGTSVPLVADIAELLPHAAIGLTAVGDARCNAHGPDESADLTIVRRLAHAQALALGHTQLFT